MIFRRKIFDYRLLRKRRQVHILQYGTLKIAADAKDVTVEVTFNRGYTFGMWFDSIVLRWGGVQTGATNITNSKYPDSIDMPGSDWFETEDQELYLIIQTQALLMLDVDVQTNGHGTQITGQTVADGNKATKPVNPTASGYTFKGWYTDSTFQTAFDFGTAIHADTTLYAKWVSNSVKPTDPNTPKTGDNSNMLLWVMLLVASGAALTGAAIYSRKKKKTN